MPNFKKTLKNYLINFLVCLFLPGLFYVFNISDSISQVVKQKPAFEPVNPVKPGNIQAEKWIQVPAGLHGSFGTIDKKYTNNVVPVNISKTSWSGKTWRGERVNAQLLLWSATGKRQVRFLVSPLKTADGAIIDGSNIKARIVRYVIADEINNKCAVNDLNKPVIITPDVLEDVTRFDISEKSTRPVWITLDVPDKAEAGTYTGRIAVLAEGKEKLTFDISLEVQQMTLPDPSGWSFHLDLWQAPWSVSGYHNVKPWSPEHWMLLKPLIKMLAEAGQKCITASIVHEAWAHQTYHEVGSMIEWTRQKNGKWSFDYTIFDKYVEFCMECGITKQINCYSMAPWSNSFRYFDETSDDFVYIYAVAGTKEFEDHWRPFLKDFSKHLLQKGWLNKTSIAMDERPLDVMQKIIKFVKTAASGLKITLAGNYHEEIKYDIHDYCVFVDPPLKPELIKERVEKALPTTFYVCCTPPRPNMFSYSPPAEAVWMGWYAYACGYSGFLRWAYNAWVEDPLFDTRFVTWPAGDCFLVYPGARSSIRFERLREGIQDYEKLRIIKTSLDKMKDTGSEKMSGRLTEILEKFTFESAQKKPSSELVNAGKKLLNELTDYISAKK